MTTIGATCSIGWLSHPHAEELLRLSLLPSTTLHPARSQGLMSEAVQMVALGPDGIGPASDVHRTWSPQLIDALGLDHVRSISDPTLPMATLDNARFEQLGQRCGIVLLGRDLRLLIDRNQIDRFKETYGPDALAFLYRVAPTLQPSDDCVSFAAADASRSVVDRVAPLGAALLWRMSDEAIPAVAQRTRLRLAPDTPEFLTQLPPSLEAPGMALQLARAVLQTVDPSWLSSYPATL